MRRPVSRSIIELKKGAVSLTATNAADGTAFRKTLSTESGVKPLDTTPLCGSEGGGGHTTLPNSDSAGKRASGKTN